MAAPEMENRRIIALNFLNQLKPEEDNSVYSLMVMNVSAERAEELCAWAIATLGLVPEKKVVKREHPADFPFVTWEFGPVKLFVT